jgi:hypothetical protein
MVTPDSVDPLRSTHVMKDGSEHPIAFAYGSLTAARSNYAQIDRKALSLVWGVKGFEEYLYGREFTLITIISSWFSS